MADKIAFQNTGAGNVVKRQTASARFTEMVTIVVSNPSSNKASTKNNSNVEHGPEIELVEERKFTIHKAYLCHHSPFFRAAFNGSFQEGETQSMILDDVDPDLFEIFVHYIYTQTLELGEDDDEVITLVQYTELWVLGQRFLMPRLQNAAMTRIYHATYNCKVEVGQFRDFLAKLGEIEHGVEVLERCASEVLLAGTSELFDCAISKAPEKMKLWIMKHLKTIQQEMGVYQTMARPDLKKYYIRED